MRGYAVLAFPELPRFPPHSGRLRCLLCRRAGHSVEQFTRNTIGAVPAADRDGVSRYGDEANGIHLTRPTSSPRLRAGLNVPPRTGHFAAGRANRLLRLAAYASIDPRYNRSDNQPDDAVKRRIKIRGDFPVRPPPEPTLVEVAPRTDIRHGHDGAYCRRGNDRPPNHAIATISNDPGNRIPASAVKQNERCHPRWSTPSRLRGNERCCNCAKQH